MGKGKGRGGGLVGGWGREKGEGVGWLEDGEGKRVSGWDWRMGKVKQRVD